MMKHAETVTTLPKALVQAALSSKATCTLTYFHLPTHPPVPHLDSQSGAPYVIQGGVMPKAVSSYLLVLVYPRRL